MIKKLAIAAGLILAATTSLHASEIVAVAPGDTIYISDIYVIPPKTYMGPTNVTFLMMMRCKDDAEAPEYSFGQVCFGTDGKVYKCDSKGEEKIIKDSDPSVLAALQLMYTGRMLMKFPDGTVLDKARDSLSEPMKAYKSYKPENSAYEWTYMCSGEYPLSEAEADRLATEGVERFRVSTYGDKNITIDVKKSKSQELFGKALAQVHALKDGTETPRGTIVHDKIPNLENPLLKDF